MTKRVLTTLGCPGELRVAGIPHKFRNSKHLGLLAYLALEPRLAGRSESREYTKPELARLLWLSPDDNAFNDALSSLREVFSAEVFPLRARIVRFDPDLVKYDAATLIHARADAAMRPEALAGYHGPFLNGFNTRGTSGRFQQWVERTREELQNVFCELCAGACAEAAAAGEWERVSEIAQHGLARAPSWEEGGMWSEAARERLEPAERVAPPPLLQPASAPPHVSVPPSPAQRFERTALVIPSVLLLLLLGFSMRGRAGAPSPEQAFSENVPKVCGPGQASARLIDEVAHFGIQFQPGTPFSKAWTLQNSGDCTWSTAFRLHYDSSSAKRMSMTLADIPTTRAVAPGDTITFRAQMRAPEKPGTYDEHWGLHDEHDHRIQVSGKRSVVARIVVPPAEHPSCRTGESRATLLVKKFMNGAVREPGERFRFGWTLKNSGRCSWAADASFRFVSRTRARVSQEDVVKPTRAVAPGESYTFLATVQAPKEPGMYGELWEFRDPYGLVEIDGLPTTDLQFRIPEPNLPVAGMPVCRAGQAKVRFVDEDWLDNTSVAPGQPLTKRWTIFNVGDCAWSSDFRLRYTSSTKKKLSLSQQDRPLDEVVQPWVTYTFEIPMRMPMEPGLYREDWRLVDSRGNHIFVSLAPYVYAILSVNPPLPTGPRRPASSTAGMGAR